MHQDLDDFNLGKTMLRLVNATLPVLRDGPRLWNVARQCELVFRKHSAIELSKLEFYGANSLARRLSSTYDWVSGNTSTEITARLQVHP
jgi:hypothetical protein